MNEEVIEIDEDGKVHALGPQAVRDLAGLNGDPLPDYGSAFVEMLAALKLIESVYRQNVVVAGEPSSVLDAVHAAIAKAELLP